MASIHGWGWTAGAASVCATTAFAATLALNLPLRPSLSDAPAPPPQIETGLPVPEPDGDRPTPRALETASLFVDVVHQPTSFSLRPSVVLQDGWLRPELPAEPVPRADVLPPDPPPATVLPPLRPSFGALVLPAPLPPPAERGGLPNGAAESRAESLPPEPLPPQSGVFAGLFGPARPDGRADAPAGRSLQTGVASWYGPGFHGRRTASGEVFNQHSMTAAHRHLPFGTKVRVINETTGRSVVVRINDRGPFKHGRVIDLSKSAAQELGMGGLARVKLVSAE